MTHQAIPVRQATIPAAVILMSPTHHTAAANPATVSAWAVACDALMR